MVLNSQLVPAAETPDWNKALLDDFSGGSTSSTIGTDWKQSAASSNNGRSRMELTFAKDSMVASGKIAPGNPMQGPGRVSLLLMLDEKGQDFNVNKWDGVRITMRRSGAPLLFRVVGNDVTNGDHFARGLPATSEMKTYDLEWGSLKQVMSAQKQWSGEHVTGVELVAYGWLPQNFSFEVTRLEFYRN